MSSMVSRALCRRSGLPFPRRSAGAFGRRAAQHAVAGHGICVRFGVNLGSVQVAQFRSNEFDKPQVRTLCINEVHPVRQIRFVQGFMQIALFPGVQEASTVRGGQVSLAFDHFPGQFKSVFKALDAASRNSSSAGAVCQRVNERSSESSTLENSVKSKLKASPHNFHSPRPASPPVETG